MLEATNLGCVRGDRRLFRDLNFGLHPGALFQVTGSNGSGKTSLLRMLCGLLAPSEGEILWQGESIHSLGEEYVTRITYIGHGNGVKDELSCLENLRISNGLAGVVVSREDAVSSLRKIGLGGREDLPARFLSAGQQRRLTLARLLTSQAAVWILDEVLTSLDKSAVALVKSLIEDHLSKAGIAIVATHQELNLSAGSFQRLELAS